MMPFFRKKKQTGVETFEDSGTNILIQTKTSGKNAAMDPNLIANFQEARTRLKHLCKFIEKQATAGEWETVEKAISKFRSKLTDHLLVETFKLYSNTKNQLKSMPEHYDFVKRFSIEMGNLCQDIVEFTEKHENVASDKKLQSAFLRRWQTLQNKLLNQWDTEKRELYPIFLKLAERESRKRKARKA